MRLWFCVHLPLLPLEAIRPSWLEPGCYAILQHDRVLVASRAARHSGVRLGMRAKGVAAVSPQTILLERDSGREEVAMNAIVMALLQYTPELACREDFCLVLDVTASLRLFGGVRCLCRHVMNSIRGLGYSATLGVGPTATAAWLLARVARTGDRSKSQPLRRRALTLQTTTTLLNRTPCHYLLSATPFSEWLMGIGANTLGDLGKLPRSGLLRRTDQTLLNELDRAYGQLAELFDWIKPPSTFSARMETFDRIEYAPALMVGVNSLILQLIGWLAATQQAVSMFALFLEHERGCYAIAPTELEIGLAEPAWQEPHLLRLLQERLARIELSAPVIAVRLEVKRLAPLCPPTLSLFPEPGASAADWRRLLELLSARIGKENVLVAQSIADYRPEVCNHWVAVSESSVKRSATQTGHMVDRPFWMLAKPIALITRDDRPFYGTPLKLLRGPERIEAGWWDDGMASRDYFVAQDDHATCYWIYLERSQEPRWFLHGLYA